MDYNTQKGSKDLFQIKFYEDRQGNKPVAEYILKLRKKSKTSKNARIMLKKITEYMRILKQYGTYAGEPYVKHIDGDIWELRPTNDRIFFFYWQKGFFVMLHHFTKKTKKTPTQEINQAKRNLQDFIEREQTE